MNPGYWRRKQRVGRYEVRGKFADLIREFALHDMIDAQFSLVVGLISYLSKTALHDTIASELRRLILIGHGILSDASSSTGTAESTPP